MGQKKKIIIITNCGEDLGGTLKLRFLLRGE
jgi:hypothetical protein